MQEGRKCLYCENNWVEKHHTIEKGSGWPKKVTWLDYDLNLVGLCLKDHKIMHDTSIGSARSKILEAKLQAKLEELFSQEYYNPQIIKKILNYTDKELRDMTKVLLIHTDGYKREDIILRLMGRK
jgi:hypothetical protein